MGYLSGRVLDFGLIVLTKEADTLYLCTDMPATYEQASEVYAAAVKLAVQISEPRADDDSPARIVLVGPVLDGEVTETAVCPFWALVDSAREELLASGLIWNPELLRAGNLFELGVFKIGIPPS
jgi:hypothetical protein